MRSGTRSLSLRVSLHILRFISVLVPSAGRKEWLGEWSAELTHRSITGRDSGAALLRRGLGSLSHAVWLRREEWSGDMIGSDLKLAMRGIRRSPGVALAAIVTSALAIGGTTAAFSVINTVILQPLPYEDPDELVVIWEHNIPRSREFNVVSPFSFAQWRERSESFQDMAAVVTYSQTLNGEVGPERVGTVRVSPSFFQLVGVQARLGRLFRPDDDRPSAPDMAVISSGLWQRRFGADPDIVGKTLMVQGEPNEIIGVLPRSFDFPTRYQFQTTGAQDLWLPLITDDVREATGRWLQVIARLEPGVTVDLAQERMTALAARIETENPESHSGWSANVVPLLKDRVGEAEHSLWVVFGAVILVLLVASANIAGLMVARASARRGEIAVRAALGAGRTRVFRELLLESLLLAMAGGGLGIGLAGGAVGLTRRIAPDLPRIEQLALDPLVLIFATLITVVTGLLFGVLPAVRASRPDLAAVMREGGARSGTRSGVRVRAWLVATQVAVSLILLTGAGLLLRSLGEMLHTGVGVRAEGIITANVNLPDESYEDHASQTRFFQAYADTLAALPGVESAAGIVFLPLAGPGTGTSFWVNDRPVPAAGDRPVADIRWVLGDYFGTMDVPLLDGRTFDEGDGPHAPLVVVVNRYLAEEFWPGEAAIGQTITMPWDGDLVAEIIGVVGNVRHDGPGVEPRSMIYWNQAQFGPMTTMTYVVRTRQNPEALVQQMRAGLESLDSSLPLYSVRTMEGYLAEATARQRFLMVALGFFALVALTLASVGIYGVMSYSVTQRTREFGIRIAMGARPMDLIGSVVGRGLKLVLPALLTGTVGSLLLGSVMESMVFGISPRDPITIAGVGLLLGAVTMVASAIPARRAARVAPTEALRYE